MRIIICDLVTKIVLIKTSTYTALTKPSPLVPVELTNTSREK